MNSSWRQLLQKVLNEHFYTDLTIDSHDEENYFQKVLNEQFSTDLIIKSLWLYYFNMLLPNLGKIFLWIREQFLGGLLCKRKKKKKFTNVYLTQFHIEGGGLVLGVT